MDEGFLVSAQFVKQVEAIHRRMMAQYWNPTVQRGRWQQLQPNQGCVRSYDLRLLWNPEAADMSIDIEYNSVTETIHIAIDDDAIDVKTAVDAHTEFVLNEVECVCESAGGFPSSNIFLTLPEGAKIVDSASTLTRRSGSPTPEFRVDICGCRQ